MKIKILLAPGLIVVIVVAIIWYVYPAYDGVDGVRDRRAKMTSQDVLTAKLDGNISSAEKLGTELRVNATQNAVVFNYIPKGKEEEKIIENLNLQATGSTLAVLEISVSELADVVAAAEVSTLSIAPPIADPVTGAVVLEAPKVVPKKLKVKYSVVGDYANIKVLIGKIQKLKRFNKFLGLDIKTLMTEGQEISDSLQANMTLEFNYLSEPKRLTDADLSNEIFSATGGFSSQIIGKIRESRNVEVNNVMPGQKRGNNPFIIAK
ncbi:MAG: hypothetical protein WCO05_00035 [Candidatus Moraniibacteriota bacterium]